MIAGKRCRTVNGIDLVGLSLGLMLLLVEIVQSHLRGSIRLQPIVVRRFATDPGPSSVPSCHRSRRL